MRLILLSLLIFSACGRSPNVSVPPSIPPTEDWFNCSDITKHDSRETQNCELVKNEIKKASELYLSQLGSLPSLNWKSLYYHATKIHHIDSRGVPVLENTIGSHSQAYYDGTTRTHIFYANPYAIHCEALHVLRQFAGLPNKDWEIIGHNTTDDPLQYYQLFLEKVLSFL